jgi:hypothetical protein
VAKKKKPWERKAPPPCIPLPPEPPPPTPPKPLPTASAPDDLAQLTLDDLLRAAGALIVFNPKRLYCTDGSPLPLDQLDDATALAIQALEVYQQYEGSGEARVNVGVTKKIRQYDRLRAIEIYAELKGWKAGKGAAGDKLDMLAQYLAAVRDGDAAK